MLEEIRIRGLGVIEDAVLSLSPGLTVVTGETGAGKTMIVTGLGLLLGQRADPALVRPERPALVEGRIVLPSGHPAIERAVEAGAELDDGVLIVARTVSAEGRSRAHVGGRSVPAAVLAEMADDLVAVHGQADQLRLRRPGSQRAALDRFSGPSVSGPLASYVVAFDRHRELSAVIDGLVGSARERARESDRLRFGLAEIDAVRPRPGEDEAVMAELARLEHVEALRSAAETARSALADEGEGGSGSAATGAGVARSALSAAIGHDPGLDKLGERVRALTYDIDDVAAELASYARGLDDDPERLAELQDRRAALVALNRKYGGTTDAVLAWAAAAAEALDGLAGDDERISQSRDEQTSLRADLARLAGQLTIARTAAAAALAERVTAELAELAMAGARLHVEVSQTDEADESRGLPVGSRTVAYGRHGVDSVELLLEPHPGAPPRALQKGASGGELSRVMLAVEVVLAGADPVPIFVFDEIDAGVGGRAAAGVGARLARLARTAQVLVVTHLPQVAAFADLHFTVRKAADGSVVSSGVERLDDAGRQRELSRMLAGLEDSDLARAHAAELLAVAAAEKAI